MGRPAACLSDAPRGIVLAVTGSVPHGTRWIGGGVLAGVAAAFLVVAFAGALSQLFEGMGAVQ